MPTGTVILLAYAGDFEGSVAVAWLEEHYQTDVVTVTLDLGQGTDLADVRDRALAIGAVRAHVLDVREEFARSAVAPALAHGVTDPRVASLARPVVARYLARVAAIEGTQTVAHGSRAPVSELTGIESLVAATDGSLRVLAPCRDWGLSDAQTRQYAKTRGIPLPSTVLPLTAVRTLWGRALMGDLLADPWAEVPPSSYSLTRSVTDWSATPATLDLEFAGGVPTSLNGVTMPLVELLSSLETIAGSHGLGRLDFPAIAGVRPRIVEEAPAPFVLHQAMKALSAVVPAMWPAVHGTVRLRCLMGECRVEEVGV
jgi:argininosuccinate synthase